jgi:ankyrin repeat protein
LIDAGAGDFIKDVTDTDPLFFSVLLGSLPFLRFLIKEKGFDVNQQDDCGRTALHMAASKGNSKIVDFLFKCGANPKLVDYNGATPLHYLTMHSYENENTDDIIKSIDILVDKGVNPIHRRQDNGEIALDRIGYVADRAMIIHLDKITRNHTKRHKTHNKPPPCS